MDKLDNIFELQQELQRKMPKEMDESKQEYINQMFLALFDELTEAMRETKWKNPDSTMYGWKKGQKFNEEAFKEELVDALHFFINLCLASRMDSNELFTRYVYKRNINKKRQKNEY